jgi:ATP synthase in type III secretion protein N
VSQAPTTDFFAPPLRDASSALKAGGAGPMSSLAQALARAPVAPVVDVIGRVARAHGTIIHATGISPTIGEVCLLHTPGHTLANGVGLEAEVIGVSQDHAILTPMGRLEGISSQTQVICTGKRQDIAVGPALLGRVVDAHGRAIDGRPLPMMLNRVAVHNDPPAAMTRPLISQALPTGVRCLDSLLTCGRGQRLGVFAVAGAGKSTLLGMLARGAQCDVIVVALIGERGREVQEFLQDNLGADGLARAVVVVATSDRPALERARAAQTATAIAEYFRDQGQHVLLLMDSVTRYARALRDVGLAVGEMPARHGFPPSVFAELPRLFERAGASDKGAITAFYTVLMEEEDSGGPVEEEVRSILDGHIVLSRKLADAAHFPAIDALRSISRVMTRLVSSKHMANAHKMRRWLAKYQEIEMLIQLGEYKPGGDAQADAAVKHIEGMRRFLQQGAHELAPMDETLQHLGMVVS